jgi:hypothetical protein
VRRVRVFFALEKRRCECDGALSHCYDGRGSRTVLSRRLQLSEPWRKDCAEPDRTAQKLNTAEAVQPTHLSQVLRCARDGMACSGLRSKFNTRVWGVDRANAFALLLCWFS